MSKDTALLISVPNGEEMATLAEQIELELNMVQSGIDRYNKQKDDLEGKTLSSKTLHGRTIIAGVVEPVADGIRDLLKEKTSNRSTVKLLKNCKPNTTALLSLIAVVDTISNWTTLIRSAGRVGIMVETQLRLDAWLKADRETAKNLIKMANQKSDSGYDHKRHGLNHKINKDKVEVPSWTSEERIHIGLKLINIIIERTGIVKLERRSHRRHTVNYLAATEDTLEWIKAFNETHEKASPRFAPCVIEPKDWTSFYGGGYHSNYVHDLSFMRVHG